MYNAWCILFCKVLPSNWSTKRFNSVVKSSLNFRLHRISRQRFLLPVSHFGPCSQAELGKNARKRIKFVINILLVAPHRGPVLQKRDQRERAPQLFDKNFHFVIASAEYFKNFTKNRRALPLYVGSTPMTCYHGAPSHLLSTFRPANFANWKKQKKLLSLCESKLWTLYRVYIIYLWYWRCRL